MSTETAEQDLDTPQPMRQRGRYVLSLALIVIAGLSAGGGWWMATPSRSAPGSSTDSTLGAAVPASPGTDQEVAESSPSENEVSAAGQQNAFRPEQLTGRWLLNDNIRREVEMRPDGTATMNVKLDLVASLFYGSEMTLNLIWDVKNGMLTHTLLDGTPKDNVDRLIKDFGNSRSYRVVRLNEKEMVLEDTASKSGSKQVWVAVE